MKFKIINKNKKDIHVSLFFSLSKLYIPIIIFVFHSLLANPSNEEIIFQRIGIEEGLAPGNVNDIIQDSLGFIWLGTESGLCRYDGYNFKVFKSNPKDVTSLSFNHVFSLHKDKKRIIWVGTLGGGLNKFDTRTEKFTHYKFNPDNNISISSNIIYKVFEDSEQRLWISTLGGGLNLLDKKSGSFTRYSHSKDDTNSISSNMVSAIFEDSKGNFWVGTFDAGLNLFDVENQVFHNIKTGPHKNHSLNHNQVMDIIEYSKDTLLIATFGGGINVFNTNTGMISHYQNEKDFKFSTEHKNVRKLFDDGNNIWIGSYNGLYKYSKNDSKIEKYINDQNNERSLNNNKIREIFKDGSEIIWVGTTNGVNLFDPNRKKFDFQSFEENYSEILGNLNIIPSFIKNPEIYWAKLDNSSKTVNQGKIFFFRELSESGSFLRNYSTNFYKDENNTLWIGDYDGLKYFDKDLKRFKYIEFFNSSPSDPGNNFVKSFFIDSNRDFWAGTLGGGLTHLDRSTGNIHRFIHLEEDKKSISDSRVLPILEDKSGNLWIGTYGGLNRVNRINFSFIHYTNQQNDANSISNNRIYSIYESKSSGLWIGTYQGLNKYSYENDHFERVDFGGSLSGKTIYSILEDNLGNLWLRTNTGISMFDPNRNLIKNYGRSDGLEGANENGTISFKNENGRLLFGTSKGLYSFLPELITDNLKSPEVVFTKLKILDDEIEVGDKKYLNLTLNDVEVLELSYLDKIFTIEFSALHFAIPSKNKYAYMLEGFRDKWTYVDANNRSVTFTNLNPGEYTFHVKASNNDGIWNEVGRSIKIVITPPYWATWWFRLLVVLSILAIVFIIYEYRLQRLLEIERTRGRIARNLHDDVGGTLASIQYFVDGIKKAKDSKNINKFLNLIMESSNDAQEKIRDIIWTVNPSEDGLSKFFIKFKRYASDLFDSHDINYIINFPKVDAEKKINMEKRQHLWCICKETITNVIKHSH